jgi:hypothetical protein
MEIDDNLNIVVSKGICPSEMLYPFIRNHGIVTQKTIQMFTSKWLISYVIITSLTIEAFEGK